MLLHWSVFAEQTVAGLVELTVLRVNIEGNTQRTASRQIFIHLVRAVLPAMCHDLASPIALRLIA